MVTNILEKNIREMNRKIYDALETDTNFLNTVSYIVKQNTTQISKWLVLLLIDDFKWWFLPQAENIATDLVLFFGLKSIQHKYRKKLPTEFTANTKYSLFNLQIAVNRRIFNCFRSYRLHADFRENNKICYG